MQRKNLVRLLAAACALVLAFSTAWLITAGPASAQCGSQASSCKNCHEVQAQMPVNSDGTDWHTAHAFGDFCHICHAGNNQAMDINLAHTGMVPPLSDIKAGCLQCHPTDYEALAQGYADTLGVEIGAVSAPIASAPSSDAAAQPEGTGSTVAPVSTANLPALGGSTELAVNDPNLVDFATRYDEIVLGKKPVNMGNAILIGLIGLVLVGGGGFVIKNEDWLDISALRSEKVEGHHSQDIVSMLPDLEKIDPKNRKKLAEAISNPAQLEKALKLFDILSEEQKTQEGPR